MTTAVANFNWKCKHTWMRSAHNTKWCLIGCAIGDMGTILFFQVAFHFLDADGNGKLSLAEFQQMLMTHHVSRGFYDAKRHAGDRGGGRQEGGDGPSG